MTEFIHHGDEKQRFLRRIFADIAPRYDFLNHILSCGLDIYWRRRLVNALHLQPGETVLDLASGTGDVALTAIRGQPRLNLIAADATLEMLAIGRRKFSRLIAAQCDAEELPFKPHTFHVVTVAFGVRNFGNLDQGLVEIYRILKPGGRFGILEFAFPEGTFFRRSQLWYLSRVLPLIASIFSRADAYRYLPESISHFPSSADFVAILESVGYSQVETVRLPGGVAWIYLGWK